MQPKSRKYRKAHKGRIRGVATRGVTLNFSIYGLQALESGRISARQIEATRRVLTRVLKRKARIWIRIFPDIPVTRKPNEIRMGKGKGNVDHWIVRVKKNKILFEVEQDVPFVLAKKALLLASHKLPIKTRFIHN